MAVVMSQQPGRLWQRRASHGLHVPPQLNVSSMMSPFDMESSIYAQQMAPGPFQQTQMQPARMDLAMPAFPSPGLTSAMLQAQSLQEAYGYTCAAMPPTDYTTTYNPTFALQQPFQYPFSDDVTHIMPSTDLSQSVLSSNSSDLGSMPYAASDISHSRKSSNTSVSSLCLDVSSESSPFIKSEVQSPVQPSQLFYDSSSLEDYKYDTMTSACSPVHSTGSSGEDSGSVDFNTDVDTLMKAIQAKTREGRREREGDRMQTEQQEVPTRQTSSVEPQDEGSKGGQRTRKKYQCNMDGCEKLFYQKTHLEIHTRAHTGVKPFLCKEPSCGQRFSQLGNLKTHERRHTGERPYPCDICGKSFAQRGNVRAHKIVHMQIKPFTCRLDGCGKMFTQLGNLKSHQNKFHPRTLRALTLKFSTIHPGDKVSATDKELWEYFAGLYKNSNKGIKGRGKGRGFNYTGGSGSLSKRGLTRHKREDREDDGEEEHKFVFHGADLQASMGPVDVAAVEMGRGTRDSMGTEAQMFSSAMGADGTRMRTHSRYASGSMDPGMGVGMDMF